MLNHTVTAAATVCRNRSTLGSAVSPGLAHPWFMWRRRKRLNMVEPGGRDQEKMFEGVIGWEFEIKRCGQTVA